MYNRWFIERVPEAGGGGWKIHIEVYVANKEDAIDLMNKHAKQITEESRGDNVKSVTGSGSA